MVNYIGQLKIAVNNHVRDDPLHTLLTYTVSEIETQCCQRIKQGEVIKYRFKKLIK